MTVYTMKLVPLSDTPGESSMFDRFTDRARRSVTLASEIAEGTRHAYVSTEHLLLGIIAEGESAGLVVLQGLTNVKTLDVELRNELGTGPAPLNQKPQYSAGTSKAFEDSLRMALQLGHNFIGTEHLVMALLHRSNGASIALNKKNITLDGYRQAYLQTYGGLGGVFGQKSQEGTAPQKRLEEVSTEIDLSLLTRDILSVLVFSDVIRDSIEVVKVRELAETLAKIAQDRLG